MSSRGKYGRAVPADKRELTAEARADYERRLARAVGDVLDGAVSSAGAAAKNRGVSPERVRAAVKAARTTSHIT